MPKKKGRHNTAHQEMMSIYGNADNPAELRADLGESVTLDGKEVKLGDDVAWQMLQEDARARAEIAEQNKLKAEGERKAAVQLAKQLDAQNKAERAKHESEKAKYETEKARSNLHNTYNTYNLDREADQLRDTRIRLQNELENERLRRALSYPYPSDATQVARYLEKERIKKEVKQELEEDKKLKRVSRPRVVRRSVSKPRKASKSKSKSKSKGKKK